MTRFEDTTTMTPTTSHPRGGATLARILLLTLIPGQMWAALMRAALAAEGWDRVALIGLSMAGGAEITAGLLLYSTFGARR